MEQQLQNLQATFLAGLAILVPAVFLFAKSHLELRTKYGELKLKAEANDIDDTAMKNKISVEAQKIIQVAFMQNNDRIQALESTLQHQRDLIDSVRSEHASTVAQKDEIEKKLIAAQAQQLENVKKLAALETYSEQVKSLTDENAQLKGQVADLRQKVEDASVKADLRHAEMNRVTSANAELEVKLRQANAALDNARQLLQECNDRVLLYEQSRPVVETVERLDEGKTS